MKDDIRYSEFLFLRDLEKNPLAYFNPSDAKKQNEFGLHQAFMIEMVLALAEDLYVKFESQDMQFLVGKLRREVISGPPGGVAQYQWDNPRNALFDKLLGGHLQQLNITYRGMRRIEELRDVLKRDRILEPFGVMLDMRYFPRDLDEALSRSTDIPVSVLRLDMDRFKNINDVFGHAAGDEVMKAYLETVRDCVGGFGSCYRGRGDEVATLIVGQDYKRAIEIAQKTRADIEALKCNYKETSLPTVTASIGVATTPPEARGKDLESVADERQSRAKKEGKNCVVST